MAVAHTMELKGNGLDALANILSETPKRLPKELSGIANKVAKSHAKDISKEVRKELAITAKEAGRSVSQTEKATPQNIRAIITVRKGFRPSLKAFKPRQTKTGVSYKISKTQGRKKILSAFIAKTIGGHVFKRTGKDRLPIQKLRGPSVWGVYVKGKMLGWSKETLIDEYGRQVQRRIRAVIVSAVKKQGRLEGLSTDQINQRIKAATANL